MSAGLAIYDTMQHIRPNVATICVGDSISMAAILLAAGTKGKRYAMPHSSILFHNLSAGTSGNISDIRIAVQEMERTNGILQGIIAENTGRSIEEVKVALDRDNWMTPEEAMEFGAIDKIILRK